MNAPHIPPLKTHTLTATGVGLPVSEYGTSYLHVHSLTGREMVNGLYEYSLTLRTRDEYGNPVGGFAGMAGYISKASAEQGGSPGSQWDIQSIIGTQVDVAIQADGRSIWANTAEVLEAVNDYLLPNQSTTDITDPTQSTSPRNRHISGIVTRAEYTGVESSSALYTLTLRPWVWLLTQTRNSRIYQHISPTDVIQAVLADYPYRSEWRVTQSYPVLDYLCQYAESDHDFIHRLCAEYGLNYWFEHNGDDKPGHTLIIADHLGAFTPQPSTAFQNIWVYPPNLKLAQEYIHTFDTAHSLTTGQVTLADYQFKTPQATLSATAHNPWDTRWNEFEVYEHTQGDWIDEQGQHKAHIRQQAHRQHAVRMNGVGNLRGLHVAHRFTLHNHPSEVANRSWIVLATQTTFTEVAPEAMANQAVQFTCEVKFTVQPDTEQVRPDPVTKPDAALQTATVVGPLGQEVWTDQYGRVKVQFHWHRGDPANELSTCWIRCANTWAGNEYGASHIPRIGAEVIVDFINGDIDMPLIVGRVTNPEQMPPWSLPTQYVLSGFRSKELAGQGNNHLIMDDTTGEIQVQLGSSTALSQLNLGFVTRIPDTSGRADYRGQGFELRTDGYGAIRADKGLYITSYGRANARAHIKDMNDTVGLLKGARSQHKSNAQLAIDHKADERAIDETVQSQLKAMNEDVAGSAVIASEAKQSSAGNASVIAGKHHQTRNLPAQSTGGNTSTDFPELAEPHLIMSSPAGIAIATQGSAHIAAGEHIALSAGQDVSLSVGQRFIASAAKGISLFTRSAGIKAFAAKGKVQIQAQSDELEVFADQVAKFISAKKSIEIVAKDEILLTAKGSYMKINAGGIEQGTPTRHLIRAASYSLAGAKGLDVGLPEFEKLGNYHIKFKFMNDEEKPHKNKSYFMMDSNGVAVTGKTNDGGETEHRKSALPEEYEVHVDLNDAQFDVAPQSREEVIQQHFRELDLNDGGVTDEL